MQSPTDGDHGGDQQRARDDREDEIPVVADVAREVVVSHAVADEEQELRAESEHQHRARQRRELRDRVVEPGDGAGEVEGERPVALVASDELGRHGRAEEHEDDAHVREVVLVLEELDVLVQAADDRADPELDDRRHEREDREREWEDLAGRPPTEPEALRRPWT